MIYERKVGRLSCHHLFRRRGRACFLLTVFGKGEKVSLSKGERNALAALTKTLKSTL